MCLLFVPACDEAAVTVEGREEEVSVASWRREAGWWGEMVWAAWKVWCSRCVLAHLASLLVLPLALASHLASPFVSPLASVFASPASLPASPVSPPVSAAAGPVVACVP